MTKFLQDSCEISQVAEKISAVNIQLKETKPETI